MEMLPPGLTTTEQSIVTRLYASAKRGLMSQSLKELSSVVPKTSSPAFRSLQMKYSERFTNSDAESADGTQSLLDQTIQAFQTYWRKALLEEFKPGEGSEFLFSQLAPHVNKELKALNYSEARLAELGIQLKTKLLTDGIKSIWGRVLPHYEFMAWKIEKEESATINLPGGIIVQVDVTYLDDFVSLGWTGFATFDKIHNGGWATKDRLYCVRPYYDMNSERFRVSYLAHEARHFSDYRRYPSLQQSDLEYRAKLTELAMADETLLELAKAFKASAFNDPTSPHAFAAYHVTCNLEREVNELYSKPNEVTIREQLRKAALALLDKNDALLESMGGTTVQSVLQ